MNITVEDAATRLNISVATVRRYLASGQIAGQKIGGRWLVHADKLGAPASTQSATGAIRFPSLDVSRAFAHLKSTDLKDLWVPDILQWEDYARDPSQLLSRALTKAKTLQVDGVETVEVPKGEYLSRAGSLLTLEDRIAYHAICLTFATDIEKTLDPRVYSSRLNTKEPKRRLFKSGFEQWKQFEREVQLAQLSDGPWVAETDLVSYFETISHRLLFEELAALGLPTITVNTLRRLIDGWREGVHHGLPTGPDVSRLLGNFFMVPIDNEMRDAGLNYYRYMDDIRIVASSERDAVAALRKFEIACRRRGLIVSSSKTKVRRDPVDDSQSTELDVADYFFRSGVSEARKVLRKVFTSAVAGRGVKVTNAKFALARLSSLVDKPVLKTVMSKLASLKEVSPVSALYLRSFMSDQKVQNALSQYLDRYSEPVLETYQHTWLLAAMLEVTGQPPAAWIKYSRSLAQDGNAQSFVRNIAVNLLVLGRKSSDVAWVREQARKNYDPAFARGCLAALARIDNLDKETKDAALRRHPQLECTLKYLEGRKSLPSLMQKGLWNSIRSVPNT